MLISEDYRAQNATMHMQKPQYGSRGAKWADTVFDIASENGFLTVLDYGCGKGTLSLVAPPWIDVREYDPAIAGKDGLPELADFVVCTDVLEHIEPELLSNVISHIHSIAGKAVLFSIATVASLKHLPDGRSTHQLVHDKAWWSEKLGDLFEIRDLRPSHKTNFVCLARPIRELGEINSVSAMSDQLRNENVRRNSEKISRRLRDNIPPHNRRAVLVCYGPSLEDTLPVIQADAANLAADIFCVGASHKYLLDNGMVPLACVDCDPRQRNVEQLGEPHPDVAYWLASCVDPSYLKKLEKNYVTLWHIHNGEDSANFVWDIEPEAWLLVGGGSVGLRAICLLYSQGYRSIDIHGMDSSYDDDREYAGSHIGPAKKRLIRVTCNGRTFTTNLSLTDYARQFMDDQRLWEGTTFRMFGDGLLQEMVKVVAK